MTSARSSRTLELLAPAKNLEIGMAAIDHGADAVYIGASRFGARASAGNSTDDIARLSDYAHQFGAKVHVTLNTIIYDDELDETVQLAEDVARAGADALLVQDMGLLSRLRQLNLGLSLHASTQCDTRTAQKARWLQSQGFERVVLARELSVDEIAEIHRECPDLELEVFVHGALCVSYSGLCYASQHCFGRSANRGECAQFCRMKYNLVDSLGRTIVANRYLLSLKDMCQIGNLEAMIQAGATAFKIEGRLKDIDYVKNVVAAYSQRLDQIIEKSNGRYRRESRGRCSYTFTPNLVKTFNRGYTTYFAHGRQPDMASALTPKSTGQPIGHVKDVGRGYLSISGTTHLANGDGLCFFNRDGELEGFRVNRVGPDGKVYPHRMPASLRPGTKLMRNYSAEFSKTLSGITARRKMSVDMLFDVADSGFKLAITSWQTVSVTIDYQHIEAQKPQEENIRRQLSKLGNTPYSAGKITISPEAARWFVPASMLADARRRGIELLEQAERSITADPQEVSLDNPAQKSEPPKWQKEYGRYPYLRNIANREALRFYEEQGIIPTAMAFELGGGQAKRPLIMQCRYCLRHELGYCVRHGGKQPTWKEPLHLVALDGRRFRLEFDCEACQMNIYAE